MNHTAFFAAVKSGGLSGCYLFEGAEEYIKRQALARLTEALMPADLQSINVSTLSNPAADELIAACETLPFLSERRLVVVTDCDLLAAAKKAEDDAKIDALLSYLPRLSPSTTLVFYQRGKADGRKKLYLALKKLNAVVTFEPMSDTECAAWIQRTLKQRGKLISPRAAEQLMFTVGRDAALLRQEMDKLTDAVGDREQVTERDIADACAPSLECTVFQMIDAQVAGDLPRALTLLRAMLQRGEDSFGVLAMLLRQYRILYHIKALQQERAPSTSLAGLLGIPPFSVTRMQQQARAYSLAQLQQGYDLLYAMEQGLKSGTLPQDGLAQQALLQLDALLRAAPTA